MGCMTDLAEMVDQAVRRVRVAGTDLHSIEVKKASGGTPKTLPETISAFANGGGGLIILGLDESAGFVPVGSDPKPLAQAVISACADAVEPAIRAEIDIVDIGGIPVVAAVIPPLEAVRKPCYVRTQGIERGSYIRGHDGDRHLTTYEVHAFLSGRGQPKDDVAIVPDATMGDLNPEALAKLIDRLRRTRGPVFQTQDDKTLLRMVGVLAPGTEQPTLAGLLCLGTYPQQFFPQLDITFVAFPSTDGRPMPDGTRFLDNVSVDGPIPQLVSLAEAALIRNMTRRAVITGSGREDTWEYPLEVVRELIVNAIMHRDYHPLAQGSQIRMELYPDRLTLTSPGGLFGVADPDVLMRTPITSSRNNTLSKLLEDIEMPGSGRTIAENRGSGLIAVSAELNRAHMPPAHIASTISHFTVEISHRDDTTLREPAQPPTESMSIAALPQLTQRQSDILRLLNDGDIASAEISTRLGISRQAVLKHLAALESLGLAQPTSNKRTSKATRWHRTQ